MAKKLRAKQKAVKQATKAIVEVAHNGSVFVYRETPEHHEKVEPMRSRNMRRLYWQDMDNNCRAEPGTYIVADIA